MIENPGSPERRNVFPHCPGSSLRQECVGVQRPEGYQACRNVMVAPANMTVRRRMVTCVDQEMIGAFDRDGRHTTSVSHVIRAVKWRDRTLGTSDQRHVACSGCLGASCVECLPVLVCRRTPLAVPSMRSGRAFTHWLLPRLVLPLNMHSILAGPFRPCWLRRGPKAGHLESPTHRCLLRCYG